MGPDWTASAKATAVVHTKVVPVDGEKDKVDVAVAVRAETL